MKIKLFILGVLSLVLLGCNYDYNFEKNKNVKISKKESVGRGFSIYTFYGDANQIQQNVTIDLILPNNFGEVDYIITITNGIQAWKP